MQLHLDFRVDSRDALARHRRRALALGATDLLDCTDEEGESRHVLADPAGHPFCILTQDG